MTISKILKAFNHKPVTFQWENPDGYYIRPELKLDFTKNGDIKLYCGDFLGDVKVYTHFRLEDVVNVIINTNNELTIIIKGQ